MANIPVKFRRVAVAFDDVTRARPCESSGSEHLSETCTDLSDLVKSFIERGNGVAGDEGEIERDKQRNLESESYWSDSETKDELRSLFGVGASDNDDADDVKRKIRDETELACRYIGDSSSSPEFKRRLMTRLRDRGFDAGLCKSRREKTGRHPAGTYEYIDVNVDGTRYIVEVLPAGEFDIARPTSRYTSLLDVFPDIFVGRVDELKRVVRLMCTAMRDSMKSADMHVPPWRRNGYMQAKWFGSYKRTINAALAKNRPEDSAVKQSIGFEALPGISCYCKYDFASRAGLKVGLLAAALNGDGVSS